MYAACFPFSLGLPKGFCAVIASLLLEIMLKKLHIVQERDPLKKTQCRLSLRDPLKKTQCCLSLRDPLKKTQCRLSLGCWQSSLHLLQCQLEGVGVCLLAGANVCHNKFLYFFIYTVHTPSVPFHTPSKLTDFDGILCFLYSPPKIIS